MAYKQPRIPPLREEEGAGAYLRELILFLKDFCLETWLAVTKIKKQMDALPGDAPLPFCDDLPKAPGAASAGQAETIARGDHVHPLPSAQSIGAAAKSHTHTASDVGAIAKTGGVATGTVKAHTFVLGNANDYPLISFEADDETKGRVGAIQYSAPDNGRRFSFLHYPANQDGASSKKFESFQLPKPEADLAESKYYSIYTTKNPPKVQDVGGLVGWHEISVTSGSIAAGATGAKSVSFTAITGASKYYAVLMGAGTIYGWVTSVVVSDTAATVTFYNSSSAAHTLGVKVLVLGVK